MLLATCDADASVSIAACEFWPIFWYATVFGYDPLKVIAMPRVLFTLAYARTHARTHSLSLTHTHKPYTIASTFSECEALAPGSPMGQTITDIMPRLIPALMAGMVYNTEAIENFSVENAENEAEADRIEDIRPIFHKNRAASGGGGGDGAEEDEDDDGGDDDGEAGGQWTMRKCSAHALDILSGTFQGDIILPSMLPGKVGWGWWGGAGGGGSATTSQHSNIHPPPPHCRAANSVRFG